MRNLNRDQIEQYKHGKWIRKKMGRLRRGGRRKKPASTSNQRWMWTKPNRKTFQQSSLTIGYISWWNKMFDPGWSARCYASVLSEVHEVKSNGHLSNPFHCLIVAIIILMYLNVMNKFRMLQQTTNRWLDAINFRYTSNKTTFSHSSFQHSK